MGVVGFALDEGPETEDIMNMKESSMPRNNNAERITEPVKVKDLDGITMWFNGEPNLETENRHLCKSVISTVGIEKSWEETGIAPTAFLNCKGLVKIEIPDVDFIGESAFYGCLSLKELFIPASIQKIDYGVVAGCSALRKITVHPNNKRYCSPPRTNCIETKYDACFYKTRKEKPLISGKEMIAACFTTIIPEDVVIIGENAFTGISVGRERLVLPDSVKAIRRFAFTGAVNIKEVVGKNVIFASSKCADKDTVLKFSDNCRFIS